MFPSIPAIPTVLNHERHEELYSYAICHTLDDKDRDVLNAALRLACKVQDKKLRDELYNAIIDVAARERAVGFDAGAQLQHAITVTEYPKIKRAWEHAKTASKETQSTEKKN